MHNQRGSAAYVKVQKMGGSPRETEARALLEATRRLISAQQNPADKDGFRQAVLFNLRLWNVFAADLRQPHNALPLELKGNLLNLHRFIDKQTKAALRGFAAERLEILVSINREIVQGLSGRPAAPATG